MVTHKLVPALIALGVISVPAAAEAQFACVPSREAFRAEIVTTRSVLVGEGVSADGTVWQIYVRDDGRFVVWQVTPSRGACKRAVGDGWDDAPFGHDAVFREGL